MKVENHLDEVLDRKTTAELLGICLTTLSRWSDLPKIKVRRRVYYKRSVLMAYLDSKTETIEKEEMKCNQ